MTRLPVRPEWLAVIFVGGALGTSVRAGLEDAFPATVGTWPWATFLINLSGALLLGALLEGLAISGPDRGWRRGLRLGLGTGLLGGYTTYSSFAVETVRLLQAGQWLAGLGYATLSVVVGTLAAFVGIRGVRYAFRRRRGRT